jgi:hypothetical protein
MKPEKMNNHHRRPRSRGGLTINPNISNVSQVKHRAWHTLFENMTPEEIAEEINRVWIDPNYHFVCVKHEKGDKYWKQHRDNFEFA